VTPWTIGQVFGHLRGLTGLQLDPEQERGSVEAGPL
jgi:hypothetical protein